MTNPIACGSACPRLERTRNAKECSKKDTKGGDARGDRLRHSPSKVCPPPGLLPDAKGHIAPVVCVRPLSFAMSYRPTFSFSLGNGDECATQYQVIPSTHKRRQGNY